MAIKRDGARRGVRAPVRAVGDADPAMALEVIESAQQRWRAVNTALLVALARAGTRFLRGQFDERPEITA
ncbi:hypothetical protein [Streptomyces sp. NPDC059398]|uniref:hypothetical protein n=1 Tax=Streptomyces sp. NPDC059398 TaxID=3346820 RepID=UPI0036A1D158